MRVQRTDARFYDDGLPRYWSAKADAAWRALPEPKAEAPDTIRMRDSRVVVTIDGPVYDILESDAKVASILSRIDEHQPLAVDVNSVGGMVTEGTAIRTRLLRHKGHVQVNVLGIAASIAQFITLAGDEVNIAEGAMMMIHRPSMGGIIYGDWEEWAEQGRQGSELLRQVNETLLAALAKRMRMTKGEVDELLKAETWYTDEAAVEAGLADRIHPVMEEKADGSEPEAKAAPGMDLTTAANLPTVAQLVEAIKPAL